MASIRNLKKEINYVLGDVLDAAELSFEMLEDVTLEQLDTLSDTIFATYDELISKINDKKVENRAAHLKAIRKEFNDKAHEFVNQINEWK